MMNRHNRDFTELEGYYDEYISTGKVNSNVLDAVGESWKVCRKLGISTRSVQPGLYYYADQIDKIKSIHSVAINYLEKTFEPIFDRYRQYGLNLMLLDANLVVIRSLGGDFYKRKPANIEGYRLGLEDIGTSSMSMAYESLKSFILYGPEMWVRAFHKSYSISEPVMQDEGICYILALTVAGDEHSDLEGAIAHLEEFSSIMSVIKTGLELFLSREWTYNMNNAYLDAAPYPVYCVQEDGEVKYANKLGQKRLADLMGSENDGGVVNLKKQLINYDHTPIKWGFSGKSTVNRAVTWVTPGKTYEDITTVAPMHKAIDGHVKSVVVISMGIGDIRELLTNSAAYTARYGLDSFAAVGTDYADIKLKAIRIAARDSDVLIQGEPGTGKQRMAHGIHQASNRSTGPLVTVHCKDYDPDMLKIELFGGAGEAGITVIGKLELAGEGSIFIDEVDKMPSEAAEHLADYLEKRIPKDETGHQDGPRVIAASDADLKKLVEKGLFSKRLYGLISRNVLILPPLRRRKNDVPYLAEHILREQAECLGIPYKKLSDDAISWMRKYSWPGNTKQLKSMLEQALFRSKGNLITPEDLLVKNGKALEDEAWKTDSGEFLRLWHEADMNVSRMSRLIGVSRVTLYRYLKQYGLKG